jgi:hypothetical protein
MKLKPTYLTPREVSGILLGLWLREERLNKMGNGAKPEWKRDNRKLVNKFQNLYNARLERIPK